MIGQTTKQISIFETEEGSFVSIEEYAAPTIPLTAAPTGSPARRVELGPFDPAMALQVCAALRQSHPAGMMTPTMTSLDAVSV